MSRLRIVHRTGFSYSKPATASYNEARMLPHSGGDQFVLEASLDIRPGAAQSGYLDYWGTRVSTFEVLTPHRELSVTATSLVEVRASNAAVRAETPVLTWEKLADMRVHSTRMVELTTQTTVTNPPSELRRAALALQASAPETSVSEMALAVCGLIRERVTYMRGVTGVQSTAREAWEKRQGVCQDLAHLAVGALRIIGIPARYVSGYLHPDPAAGLGVIVAGESHAWVEWYQGGWFGYDPTNAQPAGEFHVVVGRGRDYHDVSPLRGVYAGPVGSELFVSVEVTHEA